MFPSWALGDSGISSAEGTACAGTYLADDHDAKHDDQSQHDCVFNSGWTIFVLNETLDGVETLLHEKLLGVKREINSQDTGKMLK